MRQLLYLVSGDKSSQHIVTGCLENFFMLPISFRISGKSPMFWKKKIKYFHKYNPARIYLAFSAEPGID